VFDCQSKIIDKKKIMNKNEDIFVSVIIPVYNDSERLHKCLEALENQSYPQGLYEVIIIDNNSTDNIEAITSQFKKVKLGFEATPGSYAARNKGIALAKGKILAFTDSDCIPASDWIEKGVKTWLKTPNCGLVAGRIDLFFKNPNKITAEELYDSMTNLQQKHYLDKKQFGATANIFTSKEIFEDIGLFNQKLKSGGDKEWGNRVFKAGYKQVYANNAIILHPARCSLRDLSKKMSRITEGTFTINSDRDKPLFNFIGEVYWDFKPPIKELINLFLNDKIQGLLTKIRYIYLVIYLREVRAIKRTELYFKRK
jgi:glycosyltransferase involved in cell wall biosynthesis